MLDDLTEAQKFALTALLEVQPAATVGDFVSETDEGEHVTTYRFATTMTGYPGWNWAIAIADLPDSEPTVVESELLPAEGALLAPDWIPWADRMDDYRAAQIALGEAEAELAGDDEDDLDDGDDLDDESVDEDDDDDDLLGSDNLHGGDLDGVDIDELDVVGGVDDDDSDDDDDDSDDDDDDDDADDDDDDDDGEDSDDEDDSDDDDSDEDDDASVDSEDDASGDEDDSDSDDSDEEEF